MDRNTQVYLRLEEMVRPPASLHERTIEEEDRIALEVLVLELEGPDSLARYQRRWAAGVR